MPQRLGDEGYVILHAQKIDQPSWTLRNITAFYFDNNDEFLQRLDAQEADLEEVQWVFKDVTLHDSEGNLQALKTYSLPTYLTMQDVRDSFASPNTMSFWQLPGYIRTLEETGFDASSLRVHYQSLLAQPLLFAAMILLAAAVATRPPRNRGGLLLVATGVFTGFIVFFLSSFLQALGASQQIPVELAAWAPSLICLLLGVSVIINLEDG